MLDESLNRHPRWPLYKKVRRAAARELLALGLPADQATVDAHLRKSLGGMANDLQRLFLRDIALREQREPSHLAMK